MNINEYPYLLTQANDLFHAPFGVNICTPDKAGLNADAKSIYSRTALVNEESLKGVIEVVQKVVVKSPIYISRKSPDLSMLDLKHSLNYSLFILPVEKTKRVFVMTRQMVYDSEGTQGFRIKNVIMFTFDENQRLLNTPDAVGAVVSLSAYLAPSSAYSVFTKRRISVMQRLDYSPYFPKNFAYIKHQSKVRIFQEKASCNLLTYHNEIMSLNALDELTKRRVCKELIGALCEMEAQGLLHRDVKLENILVFFERLPLGQEEMHVKISDFGFACNATDQTALKELLGSYAWASPEIIHRARGNFIVDPIGIGNDIWALGLVLYILCNGKLAPVQECLFQIERLQANIKAAETVLQYIRFWNPSFEQQQRLDRSFARLQNYRPQRVYSLDTFACASEVKLDLALDKQELKIQEEHWVQLVQSLPASPRTIQAIEHLALAMIQESPRARLALAKALKEADRLIQR